MDSKPFISIILPTRDRSSLVPIVLTFIQQQSYTNFEVIISDNGTSDLCHDVVKPFLSDTRFRYKRAPFSMDMCTHWDFAIEDARGDYLTIFCEKFMLRPDALAWIAKEVSQSQPDVLTWQFDIFDANEQTSDNQLLGYYHPLVKPGHSFHYSASDELARRFSFAYPIFSRCHRNKDSYGKIYSGCVSSQIIHRVKQKFGRVFHPFSPDFTSMVAILNESHTCVDINQSLMMLLNLDGTSNGEKTRVSLAASMRFFESFGIELTQYFSSLPIENYWIGHNVMVANDFVTIQEKAVGGVVKKLTLNKSALAYWAKKDAENILDWNGHEPSFFSRQLAPYLDGLTEADKQQLAHSTTLKDTPNVNEIYHSGLTKIGHFKPNTSAIELANIHWHEGKAPPRKNVVNESTSLVEAVRYLYDYNKESCRLLKIT